MPTAPPAQKTGRHLPNLTALAALLIWAVAAAATIVNVIHDQAISAEDLAIICSLAVVASLVRASYTILNRITALITGNGRRVKAEAAVHVSQIAAIVTQIEARLDQMQAHLAAQWDDQRDRVEARTAQTVISGVDTLRDLHTLTAEQLAAAVINGKVSVLNGHSRR